MCPVAALYDSAADWDQIPLDAPGVAGYVNGRLYTWPPQAWARFHPPTVLKTISVLANEPAQILDVEAGDADPDQAPGWVDLARGAGVPVPTLYCSRLNTWPPTLAACKGKVCNYWVADQNGVPHLVPGSVATQWTDTGPYDISSADLAWLTGQVDPVPTMNGTAVAILPTATGLGYYVVASDGGVFTKGDAVFYGSEGGKPIAGTITAAALTPSGKGYWLVSSQGAVYTHGDAAYLGGAP